MKISLQLVVMALALITLSACVIGNQTGQNGRDVDITLGNIHVPDGERAGDLSTVNGNIDIGRYAQVLTAETTNGNIVLGEYGQANGMETVNGSIDAGDQSRVLGSLETINGDIALGKGALVSRNLSTVTGDITLSEGAKVEGDIVFEHSNLSSYFESATPVLEIENGAEVAGKIYIYAPVNLVLPKGFDREKIEIRYQDEK